MSKHFILIATACLKNLTTSQLKHCFLSLFILSFLIMTYGKTEIKEFHKEKWYDTNIEEWKSVPSSYKGRFRPLYVSSQLLLREFYHSQRVKKQHLSLFQLSSSSALELWMTLYFGMVNQNEAPLFYLFPVELKQLLQLPLKQNYFSFHTLSQQLPFLDPLNPLFQQDKKLEQAATHLMTTLRLYRNIILTDVQLNQEYEREYLKLANQKIGSIQLARTLEADHPIQKRLTEAGQTFLVLPSVYPTHHPSGQWYSLKALGLKVFDPQTNSLLPIPNFTAYPTNLFDHMQTLYLDMQESLANQDLEAAELASQQLAQQLKASYTLIAKQLYLKAHGKALYYPSILQLQAELYYYTYPWVLVCTLAYSLALLVVILSSQTAIKFFNSLGYGLLGLAFCLHTLLLATRCYILERPPVTNMYETVLYVPWISVIIAAIFYYFYKQRALLITACLLCISLFSLLDLSSLNSSLDPIQPVLDANYWLTIHVLLVVGSYGIFLLAGLLGHCYLGSYLFYTFETPLQRQLSKILLSLFYIGVSLLTMGTILGGVWAAESWGRFWDWDPKEAWAFISICFYLVGIHAYTFRSITHFGLAVVALFGLMAITFTWYGVNYILGTGLHTYGFGLGDHRLYYGYLLAECLFMIATYYKFRLTCKN